MTKTRLTNIGLERCLGKEVDGGVIWNEFTVRKLHWVWRKKIARESLQELYFIPLNILLSFEIYSLKVTSATTKHFNC